MAVIYSPNPDTFIDLEGPWAISRDKKDIKFYGPGKEVKVQFANDPAAIAEMLVLAPLWEAAREERTLMAYDRDEFVRKSMVFLAATLYGNKAALAAFAHKHAYSGAPQANIQAVNASHQIAELLAVKWETENP